MRADYPCAGTHTGPFMVPVRTTRWHTMARISLAQARAGQEVLRPVVNNNGVVLVQAGARLSDSIIERLRNLGISFIVVAGPDPASDVKTPEARLAELDRRFAGHEDDPLMVQLKQVVAAQIVAAAGVAPDA